MHSAAIHEMTQHGHTRGSEGDPTLPAIGSVIAGKYRVDRVVGSGGMGVVLGATHLELGQEVAIKVLTVADDDARRDEARERFLREGRATAALHSDHVVRVYDVGTLTDGAPFMVMELLRGNDLAKVLQQSGPLSIELACDCVRQAAEAIACAHAQRIVHRDLKPANLFLTQRSDGSALVKVLDFGISKTTRADLERLTGELTLDRSVLGTPFYMSPEQVRDAKHVDERTDIWSLGLILHELLAGSPAFHGSTLPGLCAAITADPPAALRLKRPEVPVDLEDIVLRCLQKDPARRYQSARQLCERLSPWTGRTESGQPLPVAADRSRALDAELSQLRDGSTVSLNPDGGTLASAVFTKSGRQRSSAAGASATGPVAPTGTAPGGSHRLTPRSRDLLLLGATASALLLAALLLQIFAARRPAPEPDRNAAVATQLAPPAPAASAPVASAESRTFSLYIDSRPTEAQVFEADEQVGTTPLRIDVHSASVANTPRTFTVRKDGYLPYTIAQGSSAKDERVLAALTPMPAALKPNPRLPSSKPAPKVAATSAASASSGDIFLQR